jgi:hypothetical protein
VDFEEELADERDGLAGMGDLPAHQQHEAEAEEHEEQRRDAVLHADHLVVGGKDIFPPEPRLFVMRLAGVGCFFVHDSASKLRPQQYQLPGLL